MCKVFGRNEVSNHRRASGIALSYLLIAVKLVLTLLFTPFLVRTLGIEGYGMYVLIGSIVAYLHILDFGINDTVLRFFVQHENEHEERDLFLSRMLGLYCANGMLVLLATFGLSILLDPLFGAVNPPEELQKLKQMVLLAGGFTAALVALNPLGRCFRRMSPSFFFGLRRAQSASFRRWLW